MPVPSGHGTRSPSLSQYPVRLVSHRRQLNVFVELSDTVMSFSLARELGRDAGLALRRLRLSDPLR